jgi:hypothetical protein
MSFRTLWAAVWKDREYKTTKLLEPLARKESSSGPSTKKRSVERLPEAAVTAVSETLIVHTLAQGLCLTTCTGTMVLEHTTQWAT